MKLMEINWVKEKVRQEEYFYSLHGDQERQNDNLLLAEVEEVLLNGRIIEEYQDTGRGVSCLVVGFTELGKPIHVVCGKSKDSLVIITVYIPSPPKFKTPYERG